MLLRRVLVVLAVSFPLISSLTGCSSTEPNVNSPPNDSGQTRKNGTDVQAAPDAHLSHDHNSVPREVASELAKLSAEDAHSAEAQHQCPVSGELLGSMGPPIKVDVEGQPVWICCDGCKDRLLASPSEFLSELKKAP